MRRLQLPPRTDLFHRFVLIFGFAALVSGAARADAPSFSCASLEDYKSSLQQLDSHVVDSASAKQWSPWVTNSCDFPVGDVRAHLDHEDLKQQLRSISEEEDSDELKEQLEDLHADLGRRIHRLDAYRSLADPTSRPKLEAILARPEFRQVRQSDPSARLKEKLLELVLYLLSGLIRDRAAAELVIKTVVWTICAVVAIIVFVWLWRWLQQTSNATETPREIIPFTPSAKDWRQWLADARVAAQRGDLRAAVHFAYWAAISKLESNGNWRPDRARTPREYVSLLPHSSRLKPVLADITRRFEFAWYGTRQPSLTECERFLSEVEKL